MPPRTPNQSKRVPCTGCGAQAPGPGGATVRCHLHPQANVFAGTGMARVAPEAPIHTDKARGTGSHGTLDGRPRQWQSRWRLPGWD